MIIAVGLQTFDNFVDELKNFDMERFHMVLNIMDNILTVIGISAAFIIGKQITGRVINLYSLTGLSIAWWPAWGFIMISKIKVNQPLGFIISIFGGVTTTFLAILLISGSFKVM